MAMFNSYIAMLVYQRVSHVGCLLTIGFPTLINHLWTLKKRDWSSSSSVLHSGIVDYTSWGFTPILLISHVVWWLIFGDVHPKKNHVRLPRARLRDPAAAARLSRAPLRVCTPHRSPSAVLYFGKNWLAVAGHFPEKRPKVRDLIGTCSQRLW